MPVTFGQYITQARKARLMSQKELAERIKKEDGAPISPQYLNDIEHDRRNPPQAYILEQLAAILDLDADALSAMAGQLPADIQASDVPPERLVAAMKAFRRELGRHP
jgi:transcriptional regulator with XRE-family HTH domain